MQKEENLSILTAKTNNCPPKSPKLRRMMDMLTSLIVEIISQ